MHSHNKRKLRKVAAAMLLFGTASAILAEPPVSATAGQNGTFAKEQPLLVFKLVEGAQGSPYPYTPRTLTIPAGREVVLEITDHIGGCALVTDFPNLGPNGGTVRAKVPVGQTRTVMIRAPKPGRYRYHCSGNMYYGVIVAE